MLRFWLSLETPEKPQHDASSLLEQAVRLDPNFTWAYCDRVCARHLYFLYDPTSERRALGMRPLIRRCAGNLTCPRFICLRASPLPWLSRL